MSAASAPERLMSGAPETHVPTVDIAEKAGTATFVTVTALATSVPTVRRVRVLKRDGIGWIG